MMSAPMRICSGGVGIDDDRSAPGMVPITAPKERCRKGGHSTSAKVRTKTENEATIPQMLTRMTPLNGSRRRTRKGPLTRPNPIPVTRWDNAPRNTAKRMSTTTGSTRSSLVQPDSRLILSLTADRGVRVFTMNASPLWSRFSADPRSYGRVRASDADRAVVSDVLSEGYALGQLDVEEFDERTEAAAKIKTLGEVPELIEDLVLADPAEVEPGKLDDAGRAQALARLEAERVPITPEQIDAAAQKYYRDRVRRALLGAVAGPVGIVLAIWAISSIASGGFIFFWPIFVIIPTLLGGLGNIARKDEIIRNRKKELTRRARAQLGDAEAKRQLEEGEPPERDYEADFGTGLQPPHPSHPPYSPGQISRREERDRRRSHRRHNRDNPWD